MRITREAAEPIALAGVLALFALAFRAPILLLGTVLIMAVLLGVQLSVLRDVRAIRRDLAVELTADRRLIATDEPTAVTLSAELDVPRHVDVEVRSTLPVTTVLEAGDALAVRLGTLRRAARTVRCAWPVGGRMELAAPTVTVTDRRGWFESSFRQGGPLEIVVRPNRPRDMHVGRGGTMLPSAYGEHDAGPFGSGTIPGELREYVPGDTASRIDWKATARLGELYVRDFEAETDLETTIVLDHRASTGAGPPGATKLEYLRQFALAYADHARELGDPLGLLAVGEDGITARRWPEATPDHYEWITTTVQGVTPTDATPDEEHGSIAAAEASRLAAALDETEMGRPLAPFLGDRARYVDRIDERPLFRTVRLVVEQSGRDRLCLILTDDERRTELHEAVKLARGGDGRVLVFIAPTALFAEPDLPDVDDAYRSYVDFEEFRRRLDALDRVRAFEIAPGDRIGSVIAATNRREGVA